MGRKLIGVIAAWCALAASTAGAQAAEADALAISANIQARHLPFGTILDPIFASPGSNQITGYTRCGDSAIWTGHYLAAEAFRYQVTRASDALANVKNAIAGIQALVNVTGTDLLARCAVPLNSPFAAGIKSEEAANGIYTNATAGLFWVGNTSRDQYMGVIFGLGVAYDMVSDAGVQSSISSLVTRLVSFLEGRAWTVVMPDGSVSTTFLVRPDEILTLLQVARHVNPTQFAASYQQQEFLLAAAVIAPVSVDVASDDSYFKFNLDFISFYNLVRLESNSSVKGIYQAAYDLVRAHTASHQNAFFDIIDRGLDGPNSTRDSETRSLLDAWLLRPRRDPTVNLAGVVAVCGSQACQPVPVPLRPPTDFLWQRNPFQLAGGGSGIVEGAGIDYVLPYWMARYYQVESPLAAQSAAAASVTAVAPGSIASIFGPNLASETQIANPPFPLTLAGTTVTVQDSAGAKRGAPLLYVSAGQINLVVPEGTASGPATFTIANGNTMSVLATVQRVAPALFSLDGSGTGLAAATAIRIVAPNSQLQFPVPVFQCSGPACVAVPIDVGIDTPVYLSLYGTGIRGLSSMSGVQVTIHGISVPVTYAGPQGQTEGLDQVNVGLTLNLRGSGESNVVLTVDGQVSNTVTIDIQ